MKPENIILQYDLGLAKWRPYLTDFDLAWFSTATQLTHDALGSVFYAAPEQLAKPGSASAHAPTVDVFSFGQVCFWGATGSDPVPLEMANNLKRLEEKLASWQGERPAREFRDLYAACTSRDPSQRISNFREICDRLSKIFGLLKDEKGDTVFALDRFTNELVFSIVGLSPDHKISPQSFLSPSGWTSVEVTCRTIDSSQLEVRFHVSSQQSPVLAGASDYRTARKVLNERIDQALGDRRNVLRTWGTQGPYSVEIGLTRVPLNWSGVTTSRETITRVIDAIERG